MIDTLLKNCLKFIKPAIWDTQMLKFGRYIVMTLHRPANVDEESSHGLPWFSRCTPETAKILEHWDIRDPNLHTIEPLGYLEFNYLVEHAKAVITDSGGIREGTTFMGIRCMTLRDNPERPETITIGTNELLGTI